MKHEKRLDISFNEMSAWQSYLDGKGEGTDKVMKTFTAGFGDKGEGEIAVDIKVCSSLYGTPFIDAVIFQDGNDIGCLEVQDNLAGTYEFQTILKDTYVVVIPDSIEEAKEGQKKYRAVEKWLQSLDNTHLKAIDYSLKTDDIMDMERDFVIESILERCAGDDVILNQYYKKRGVSSEIDFNAGNNSPQCFTDKKDWYIIEITDGIDSKISRLYSSGEDAKTVRDKLIEDTDNYDKSYAIISVPLGVVPEV